jgi:alpha-D-ribose 1-methylphosphonate 5-triphosphate synthase subunit PhnH
MMQPGFADPVLDAQSAFRAVLEALSHPGRIIPIAPAPLPPAPLSPAMGALALALTDADTPIWQDGGAEAADWLRFHTGAPFAEASAAMFLFATGRPPALGTLNLGTDEVPQDGATLVLNVTALKAQGTLGLRGPGIKDEASLGVEGLPEGFLAERAALRPHFPRGLDIVFCCGSDIAALPRTTEVR